MIFRYLFSLSFLVFIANFGIVFSSGPANALEKSLFMATAAAFIITRKVDLFNFILFLSVFVLLLFTIPFIKYPYFSWAIFINALNQPFILFGLLVAIPTEKDHVYLTRFVAKTPIICACLGLIYQLVGLREAFGLEYTTGLARFQGSLIPAFLSGLGMVGTFAALQCILRRERFAVLIGLIDFFILLLAGGRAALTVTVIVCAASLILTNRINFGDKIKFLLGSVVAALIVASALWNRIMTRFLGSGDNGRDYMASYLEGLHSQYPSGIGFGHQFVSVPDNVRLIVGSFAAHDDFLRLTVELGAISAFLFYAMYTLATLRVFFRRNFRGDKTIIFAMLGFYLISKSDNALSSPALFPLLFLGYTSSLMFAETTASNMDTSKNRPSLQNL